MSSLGSYATPIAKGLGSMAGAAIGGAMQPSGGVPKDLRQLSDFQQNLVGAQNAAMIPIIGKVGQFYNDILSGTPGTQMPMFAPSMESLAGQYTNSRRNILQSTPARGGQLTNALTDLETERAQQVGGLDAQLRQAALGLGTTGISAAPQTTVGATGDLGRSILGQAQLSAQSQQGTGALLGKMAALSQKGGTGGGGGGVTTSTGGNAPTAFWG